MIQLHPNRYPTDVARVGLIGTLLSGTTLAWFAPLLERKSPLLEDFEAFVKEFQASFGDTDSTRTAINKIRRLRLLPGSGQSVLPNKWESVEKQSRFGSTVRIDDSAENGGN